jgi:Flp pilus assembly protein TadG
MKPTDDTDVQMSHTRWARTRRRLRRQDGQALVEFAIVLPILMLIVTGIIQFGGMYNTYITLTDSVRTGVRVLALGRGLSDPCDPAIAQTVNSASGTGLTASEVTASLVSPDTCGTGTYPNRTGGSMVAGDSATVTASHPYTLSIFGMPVFNIQLTATGSEAIE